MWYRSQFIEQKRRKKSAKNIQRREWELKWDRKQSNFQKLINAYLPSANWYDRHWCAFIVCVGVSMCVFMWILWAFIDTHLCVVVVFLFFILVCDIYILILCFYHLIFPCGVSMVRIDHHSKTLVCSLIHSCICFVSFDYLIWTGTPFAVGDMDMECVCWSCRCHARVIIGIKIARCPNTRYQLLSITLHRPSAGFADQHHNVTHHRITERHFFLFVSFTPCLFDSFSFPQPWTHIFEHNTHIYINKITTTNNNMIHFNGILRL